MNEHLTVTSTIYFRRGSNRASKLRRGKRPTVTPTGSVQRISRLMALAIHMQELVDTRQAADYANLAELAHVTRARMTQIMNLNHLAPGIQQEILHLPLSNGGRDLIREHMVRPIAGMLDWDQQTKAWAKLKKKAGL